MRQPTKKCYDCNHCEMCAWIKEVEEQGCEFFDNGNKWIPCSERLPETEISVLIWLPSHWNKNGGTIEIGFLDEDNKWNWLAESMSDYYEIVDYVSAWMPLPEPWKGERNEEGNNDIH